MHWTWTFLLAFARNMGLIMGQVKPKCFNPWFLVFLINLFDFKLNKIKIKMQEIVVHGIWAWFDLLRSPYFRAKYIEEEQVYWMSRMARISQVWKHFNMFDIVLKRALMPWFFPYLCTSFLPLYKEQQLKPKGGEDIA